MPKNNDYAGALDEQANEQQNGSAQSHAQRVFRQPERKRQGATANAIVRSDDGIYIHPATGVKLDNRGIVWAAGLTPESLFSFTTDLIAFQDKAQLWLGDTVSYLKNRFEVSETDIALQYDLNERQVTEYIAVCEAVPRDLRPDHPRISYSHIRLVHWEKYTDSQRSKYLKTAATEDMTVSQFAQYLRSLEGTQEITTREFALKVIDYEYTGFLDSLWKAISAGQITRKDRMDYAAHLVAEAAHLRNMEIKDARALNKAKKGGNSG